MICGDVYYADTYSYHMSFTNPIMCDEIQNLFKQMPQLELTMGGSIRAMMCYKQNTISVSMKKISSGNVVPTSTLLSAIEQLESRIAQLEITTVIHTQ